MNTSMAKPIAALLADLHPDPWRLKAGFSPEVEAANAVLFRPQLSDGEAMRTIGQWLQKYQPCLFGRIAAKLELISYCVLTEGDLTASDGTVSNKIQEARTQWTREGFEGRKSAFVLLVNSPTIALALPDQHMKELARKLCSLYLLEPIDTDQIYLDETFLEIPGRSRATWRWHTGVNYFCAQGDKRWWQDHRVPGGMAFSVNSVGHMAKSGRLASAMKELGAALGVPLDDAKQSKIDSLPTALEFAMRTIAMASDAASGKATELLPLPTDPGELPVPTCPVDLPAFLKDKNFCNYRGYYHTDYTIPSEYFVPNVERPESITPYKLDFTYLFMDRPQNPDFMTMGSGRRVRRIEPVSPPVPSGSDVPKRSKASGEEVPLERCSRLVKALGI